MHIYILLIIPVGLLCVLVFLPELLPRCSCCKKLKPRIFFKIHTSVGLNPGYRGNMSVCRKCSKRYNIYNLDDLKVFKSIRRKVEVQVESSMNKSTQRVKS
jgi:hypothetical protein